ncbi:hypothetical protein CSC88_28585, partial [Klebsiella pneumoniae]
MFKQLGGGGIERTASVRAQQLKRFLWGDRPHRRQLVHPYEGGKGLVGLQILRHALLNKEKGHQQR